MSEQLAKWAAAKNGGRRPDRARDDGLKPGERKALWTMRKEAKAAGSDLASGGKGGLPPSTVLGVMRKAKYRCKRCGELGSMEENGGLSVHHKSEHMEDPKAQRRSRLLRGEGKVDEPSNIVPICAKCHDAIHEKDRADNGVSEEERGHGD